MLEGPMLETLDYTIRIGSTPTFLSMSSFLKRKHLQVALFMLFTSD